MQRIRAGERRLPCSRQQAQAQTGPASLGVGVSPSGLQSDGLQLQVTDPTRRAHSLSPNALLFQQLGVDCGTGSGSGTSTPNLTQNGYYPYPSATTAAPATAGPTPAYSNLHSRHQEFLRRRRQDNALLSLGLESTTTTLQASTQCRDQDPSLYSQSQLQGQLPIAVADADGFGTDAVVDMNMNPAVAPYAYTTGAVARPTYSVRSVPVRNIEDVREMIGMRRQYFRDRFLGRQDGKGEGEGEGEQGQNSQNQEQGEENAECHAKGDGPEQQEMVTESVSPVEAPAGPQID